jgi:hypothetical protein
MYTLDITQFSSESLPTYQLLKSAHGFVQKRLCGMPQNAHLNPFKWNNGCQMMGADSIPFSKNVLKKHIEMFETNQWHSMTIFCFAVLVDKSTGRYPRGRRHLCIQLLQLRPHQPTRTMVTRSGKLFYEFDAHVCTISSFQNLRFYGRPHGGWNWIRSHFCENMKTGTHIVSTGRSRLPIRPPKLAPKLGPITPIYSGVFGKDQGHRIKNACNRNTHLGQHKSDWDNEATSEKKWKTKIK